MKKTWLLLVVMVLAFALMAVACAPAAPVEDDPEDPAVTDTAWEDIVAKGYFILGLDDNFPPMGFRDANNEIVGLDIDLAKAVAEYLGVEVQFQPIDWSTKELSLSTGEIDCIWNGLSVTEERKLSMDFSESYVSSDQIIVTLAGSDILTKADMAGKIIGTQMASSTLDALANDPETRDSFGELKEYDTFVNAMMDLDNGRLDAVVIDGIAFYGDFNVKAPEAYNVLEENFGEEEMAIGTRLEDDSFTAKLNEAMQYLKDSGKAAEISTVWFGEDILL